ncbi:MAG: PAS domain S-box protein, partial [Pseudomonadota bacterium]
MGDREKTLDELILELESCRRTVADLASRNGRREQVEEALKRSQDVLAVVLEASPLSITYFEQQGLKWTNQAAKTMFGYSDDEEVMGMRPDRFYASEEEFGRVRSTFLHRIQEGMPCETEALFRRKDGSCFHGLVKISAVDPSDLGKGTIATVFDISARKRMEDRLRESEERYRTLVEAGFDGILVHQHGKIVFANSRLCKMIGRDENELLGMDHWVIYYSDYQDIIREKSLEHLGDEKVPTRLEVKLQRRDGSLLDGEISTGTVGWGAGKAVQVWVRDISERKRTERALQEWQEDSRVIMESVEDGYYEVDAKGNFLAVNPALARILGCSDPDGWKGMNFVCITAAREQSMKIFSVFHGVWKTGEPVRLVPMQFLTRDRRLGDYEISVSLSRDSAGHRRGFRGIVRDVTERRRASEALRRSEETARALLNAVTDVALLMDTGGTILAHNDVAAGRLGPARGDLVGRNLFEMFLSNPAEERRQWCDEVIRSGRPVRFVDQEAGMYLDNSVHPLFAEDGGVERLAFFSRDITDQVRNEEALRRAKEAAETADR